MEKKCLGYIGDQLDQTMHKLQSKPISSGAVFRNIFIVESLEGWFAIRPSFDPAQDLVLTYDFALRKFVTESCGVAHYVDHLCEQSFMQENNYLIYEYFRDWHLDADGTDIFRYKGVDFGFSFRIEIWNDFTFYVRSWLCLEKLRVLNYKKIYIDSDLPLLHEVLCDMGLEFEVLERIVPMNEGQGGYFFPIHRWMNERLRVRLPRHVLRDIVVTVQGLAISWLDSLTDLFVKRARVFVQEYHPTRQLLQHLIKYPSVRVIQAHFSAASGLMKFKRERPIPVYGSLAKYRAQATRFIESFRHRRSARLILSNSAEITEGVYRSIERRVAEVLPESLRALDCVIRYLDRHPLSLEVMIGNLGQLAMLVDSVAKSRGVPSYLIVNGFMGHAYLDESKYATVINAYSTSIKSNYFHGMNNIVCLGDPRMDTYAHTPRKGINRAMPTIVIGTSGFNNTDLNSFLAVEFEFMYEVLSAIRNLGERGQHFRVVLKVRPNGYLKLYQRFTQEYFPGVVELILDNVPIRTVLEDADLFISIYSQTLFEASCLGIPVIYHKNDQEIIDPPFDGRSELVTTYDVETLNDALQDFLLGSSRFDAFLEKKVMEKYIGPLDGKNLKRNFDFVLDLLKQ